MTIQYNKPNQKTLRRLETPEEKATHDIKNSGLKDKDPLHKK